jgi:two-component system, NtrC family, sensor kinase
MLNWLSDTSGFTPRSHCGKWEEWLVYTNIFSNSVIALAYFTISIAIFYFYNKRKTSIKYSWILLLFVGFISLCGITHVNEALVFYYPSYRLFTLISTLTASVSIGTAIILPKVIKNLLTYASFEDARKAYERLAKQEEFITLKLRQEQTKNSLLDEQLTNMRSDFTSLANRVVTEADIKRLRERLHEIRNSI